MSNLRKSIGLLLALLTVSALTLADELPVPGQRLHMKILGHDNPVLIAPGHPGHRYDEVGFLYAGACSTPDDVAVERAGVLSGMPPDEFMPAIASAQLSRPAHKPGKDEGVFLKDGSYTYRLDVSEGADRPDGVTTVTIRGWAEGPVNYDAKAASQCNGYTPVFQRAELAPVEVRIPPGGEGVVTLPVLGQVKLRIEG